MEPNNNDNDQVMLGNPNTNVNILPDQRNQPLLGENPNDPNQEAKSFQNFPQNQKFPNIRGEKTIVCWNCLSVLMVKEEWTVVRCTNCDKVNRVPGTEDNIDSIIRLNDNMNHFDLYVPYVYAIITCPFCQSENRVRKDAEHIVCFQCHNSFNIQKEGKYIDPNQQKQPPEIPYPDKPIVQNHDNCDETKRLLKKIIKKLSQPQPIQKPPQYMPSKYGPMRKLVRDVDEIEEKRDMKNYHSRTPNIYNKNRNMNGNGNVALIRNDNNRYKNHAKDNGNGFGYDDDIDGYGRHRMKMQPPKNKVYDIKVPMSMAQDYSNQGIEMEELKKKLYDEIRNDPKYKDKYKHGNSLKYELNSMNTKPIDYINIKKNNTNNTNKADRADAVYKTMFSPMQNKDPYNKLYGGIEF